MKKEKEKDLPEKREKICIGIPCYQNCSAETLEDYMLMAYYFGRRYPEYDFFLAIKSKSEQFRARNAIVTAALQTDCQYLLMLDDDNVINWEEERDVSDKYEFLRKLLNHMKADPKIGIVGALYYHRGGEYLSVIMKEGKDGGFYYMREDEIKGELQEVAVQGGGCMLMDMNIFSRIPSPWFEAEYKFGTDVQICSKVRKEGLKVCCDTSIIIGHVMSTRVIVTSKNRLSLIAENASKGIRESKTGISNEWILNTAINLYKEDVEEYLELSGKNINWVNQEEIPVKFRQTYIEKLNKYKEYEDPKDFYKGLGKEQVARQLWFHMQPETIGVMDILFKFININVDAYGLDFGCGSAPVSFDLAMRGHKIDFIDVDGAGGYEFTKWRANKRNLNGKVGWKWGGPYDYILFLDSLEHLKNWEEILEKSVDALKDNGFIVTNYFIMKDFTNIEHINMDKKEVMSFLVNKGVYPINEMVFIKRDMTLGGNVS
jgi:2-polyprenyl-3-methyl-5-hydroxy-6-metoxy-1,4-benzoquinol methylase